MIKIDRICVLVILVFGVCFDLFSQSLKGYSKEQIQEYSGKVEDQIRFFEYLLNTVGAEDTPTRDKDVIIRESYLKIFQDEQVQIEDDLLLDRKVVTNKDVSSYLKDVEFFFKNARFQFNIRDIKPSQKSNGDLFFLISTDRTLEATYQDGVKIDDTKLRFFEINLDERSQDLKIASIYTTKLSRDEELLEWWQVLGLSWRSYFLERFSISPQDSIGLEKLYQFVSIDSLDLSQITYIDDLSALEALRDLRYVDISHTRIGDLSPLSNISKLEYLDISHTPTSDIQFIKFSDRLHTLDISSTQVDQITALQNLKSLKVLNLANSPIGSFEVLNGLEKLTSLNLRNSGFNNTENIKNLKSVKWLSLSGNYLINFTKLSELASLRYLDLSETNIKDISPVASLNSLETLDLTKTDVATLSAIRQNTSLKKILVDETKISLQDAENFIRNSPGILLIHHVKDLEGWWRGLPDPWKAALHDANPQINIQRPNSEALSQLISLEEIDLSGKNLRSLRPITRFVKLKKLDISDNPVEELLPLSEVKTLEQVKAKSTQIRDLSALSVCKELKWLDFENSPIDRILPVVSLPLLSYLDINGGNVSVDEIPEFLHQKPDVSLLFRNEALQSWWYELPLAWLEFFKNSFSLTEDPTVVQLHRLTNLPEVKVHGVPVTDLNPLKYFINLRRISVIEAPIQEVSVLSEMPLLENVQLSQIPVSDFSSLSNALYLTHLDLSKTGIQDLDLFETLRNLKVLSLSGTNLKNIRGLESLIFLEELDISSTHVRSIRPLEEILGLKSLSCFNTRVTERAIEKFKELHPSCEVYYY